MLGRKGIRTIRRFGRPCANSRPDALDLLRRFPELSNRAKVLPNYLGHKDAVNICDILLYTPEKAVAETAAVTGLDRDVLGIVRYFLDPELIDRDPGWSYCPTDYSVLISVDGTLGQEATHGQIVFVWDYYQWVLNNEPSGEQRRTNMITDQPSQYVLVEQFYSGLVLVFSGAAVRVVCE